MGFTLNSESFSLFVVVTIALNGVLIQKVSCDGPLLAYETVFNWKELDYQFDSSPPSTATRDELIKSGRFIRENNVITGVKVSGNRVFLTVPRWRTGVPATLVHLPYDPSSPVPANREVTNGPKLIPYPSWRMNEEGNCTALQYVQSMEIDQFGRMWVVDVGRVNIFGDAPDNKCPPKLVIIDLKTNSTVKSFEFPAEVVSRNNSFLNDIVVGCTTKDECWAYITDARDAKVIVYNLQTNKSWFVKHSTMVSNPAALIINIQGENYTFDTSVDGIALSPLDTNFNTLYFSPLSSFDLYSVPTEVLQKAGDSSNGSGLELGDASIKHVGVKSSQTDGMAIDASGLLYFGLLGSSAINSWNSSYANLTDRNQAQLVQNDIDLQWPDTFGIDDKGYVFVTTNRLQRFSTNTYDFESINFRVIRFFVGIKSYMYSKNDMVEPNPVAEPEPEPVSAAEPEPEAEAEPTGTAEPEPTVQSDALEVETTPSAVAEPEPEVEPEAEAEPTSTNTSSSAVNKDSVIKPSDKNVYEVHQDHQHHHVTNHTDVSENEINNSIAGQSSQSQIHAGASTSSPVNTIFAVFIPLILLLTTLM